MRYRITFESVFFLLIAIIAAVMILLNLTGCSNARGEGSTIGVVTHHDFTDLANWLIIASIVGAAASFAALIWVPIQRWIPLALLTTFGACIVGVLVVKTVLPYVPWVIGGAALIGALWLLYHFRSVISAIRSDWNKPQSAPNPPVINTIIGKPMVIDPDAASALGVHRTILDTTGSVPVPHWIDPPTTVTTAPASPTPIPSVVPPPSAPDQAA